LKNIKIKSIMKLNLPSTWTQEKIAIPLGTTIGVGSGSGLAYYLWRRKKRKTL